MSRPCTPPRGQPRPRRAVSDEEFEAARRGRPGDEASQSAARDNRNVVGAVLRKYRDVIPGEELEACGLHAFWRALQYHRPEFGQKFTTSLHRFAEWVCRREAQRHRGPGRPGNAPRPLSLSAGGCDAADPRWGEARERARFARECLGLLPPGWRRRVLEQYYCEGLTMSEVGACHGLSKEAARQRIRKALRELREKCGV